MTKIDLDKEKLSQRLMDIAQSVAELDKYKQMSLGDFVADRNNFPLASYWLRLGMEAVLTIATHILSRLPANGKKKDYTQILLSLGDYGVIAKDFSQRIRGMAGYRNRLVHLYWEVKPEELLSTIQENLDDFDEFVRQIKLFMEKY